MCTSVLAASSLYNAWHFCHLSSAQQSLQWSTGNGAHGLCSSNSHSLASLGCVLIGQSINDCSGSPQPCCRAVPNLGSGFASWQLGLQGQSGSGEHPFLLGLELP